MEAVDIHMPAASENVNLKHNTMQKTKCVPSSRRDMGLSDIVQQFRGRGLLHFDMLTSRLLSIVRVVSSI